MSRIRSTLDTVSKAVSGTVSGTDLLSKITRLKPSTTATAAGTVEVHVPGPGDQEATTVAMTAATAVRSAVAMEVPEREKRHEEEEVPERAETPHVQAREKPKISLSSQAGSASSSSVAKQTFQRFQPSAFSANMDETYSHLSQHVNTYFGTDAPPDAAENQRAQQRKSPEPSAPSEPGPHLNPSLNQDHIPVLMPVAGKTPVQTSPESPSIEHGTTPVAPKPEDVAPASPPSPRRGISHYLSYPRPSVQSFVGSYIAPLVPKFRSADPQSASGEKDKQPATPAQIASPEAKEKSKEEKEEEDKAQRLLSQRERIIARASVDNRTRALVQALQKVTDVKITVSRVEDLSYHLLDFPETRGVAVKERVIPCLLKLRQARDPRLHAAVRQALAVVGFTDPVKGRGIRVLSIDGGGTRGLVALQTLRKLEILTGKPVYQLFDYICGVSTGAILAFMVGVFQIPLDECEEMYRKLGSDVFKQNLIVGTVKMGWSHAYYDSEIWENILKERMGDGLMIDTAQNPKCPKVSAVSTLVNRGLPLKAYVFRNYNMLPGTRSHYLGGCHHKMWQAIRASSAAPGFFQECMLGNDLHQDGGLLINNPTALAIHECKNLWPNTPLQCVVSLGTGRYETGSKNSATYTSLKAKITNVISSATDTEEVHTMLDALLPVDTYFRFNPYMSEDIPLDESRREKLNFLLEEGRRYLERNDVKLRKAAGVLTQEKGVVQRAAEWLQLKADMYDGLPFLSKL
ncbi:calcium-independent phospholipase A2-gamma-like [Sardina pilchardus]|uniref:calcium-independent phospholipase A2-gamma-like n=1 Tax=Sardina pilchardus TaxID=27697 RepID=UPI002E111910